MGKKKTHEEFVKELNKVYGDRVYIPLGEYKGANTKILVRHNCGNEWNTIPSSLLKGHGCPVCSGKVAKLGINTIWDTDRWMVDLGVSEEDAKKYSKGSNKKISVKCPDCGRSKKMMINNIYNYESICCSCSNGKSYPEKFIFNLLQQLKTDFKTEYSPCWIANKRYDFYIKDLDIIIETHGIQHYSNITSFKSYGGRNLKQEQANDKLKREIALKNGIKYYIGLDCRKSNMDYIKNSILNSELSKLFDLSIINWSKCAEFANKNIVKEVCNYWNNRKENETTVDVGIKFNLARNTIQTYLKKGTKLGWCKYNPKEEIKKASVKSGKASGKRVEMFKNNKSLGTFLSCRELDRQSEKLFGIKLSFTGISSVCLGSRKSHKGFTFKYVEGDNNSNISKIA